MAPEGSKKEQRLVVRAFIQARMSSKRFPGKVLAPLLGRPMIMHVISRVQEVIPAERVVVATSTEATDDPLACYLKDQGIGVFRGDLDNVARRFQACLEEHPCAWFFRVCADSPLLDSALLSRALSYTNVPEVDLITNVHPRTFPPGQSVELLRAETFAGLDFEGLNPEEREHLTKVYYNHPQRYKIINFESDDRGLAGEKLAVDTVGDLERLEERFSRLRQRLG